MNEKPLETAVPLLNLPLLHKGKVRELYDLPDALLIVVTDRISAFDYILQPCIPHKGKVLQGLSTFWFDQTAHILPNHLIHTEIDRIQTEIPNSQVRETLRDRIMVVKRANRIAVECVVRGYITGNGWRQYQQTQSINGIELPSGLRKNQKFEQPIFTPAAKHDVGHDEDITFEQLKKMVGDQLAETLREKSIALYQWARDYCLTKGMILADTKFEFGIYDGELIVIDELFTPDSSRYWLESKYAWDIEIDSMDKEPVRSYLAQSSWDKQSQPDLLPIEIVDATSARYMDLYRKILQEDLFSKVNI